MIPMNGSWLRAPPRDRVVRRRIWCGGDGGSNAREKGDPHATETLQVKPLSSNDLRSATRAVTLARAWHFAECLTYHHSHDVRDRALAHTPRVARVATAR
jgi:hypothetical protein